MTIGHQQKAIHQPIHRLLGELERRRRKKNMKKDKSRGRSIDRHGPGTRHHHHHRRRHPTKTQTRVTIIPFPHHPSIYPPILLLSTLSLSHTHTHTSAHQLHSFHGHCLSSFPFFSLPFPVSHQNNNSRAPLLLFSSLLPSVEGASHRRAPGLAGLYG